MSLLSIFRRHPRADLSALLDGELTPRSVQLVEGHLASCEACAAHLEGLREARMALRSLPEAQAPRSFVLTPEMARPMPSLVPARRVQPLINGLRMTSAGLAVALAVVLVIDLNGAGGQSSDTSSLPQAANVSRDTTGEYLSSAGGTPSAAAYDGSNLGVAQTTGPTHSENSPASTSLGGVGGDNAPSSGGGEGVGGATPGPGAAPDEGPPSSPGVAPSPAEDSFGGAEQDTGSQNRLSTEVPKAVTQLDSAVPAPTSGEIAPASAESGGGSDGWTVAAIVLGVLFAAALIGSMAVSRLARKTL